MPNIDSKYRTDEIKIDVFDIIRDLIKDCWLIVLVGIAAAMISYIIADELYVPEYTTSATFVVTTKGNSDIYENLDAANTVAQTLTNIFSSDVLAQKVAMDIGRDTVPGSIGAEVINETNLFELSVTADSPSMAYQIIKSIINNYTSVTSNVFGNAILDLLEAPELPAYASNYVDLSTIMRNSFFIGMLAMAAILVLLSISRDNIKNEKEVAMKLDTKLFGVVYHENKNKTLRTKILKKNKSILITSPIASFSFVEAIKKMRTKFEYKVSQKGSNVLLVTSVLENEGKSTIATNLALALAQKSKNVLLVDADFSKPSIYKILEKKVQDHQELGDCIINMSDIKDALTFDEKSGLYLLIGSKLYNNSTDLVVRESFQKLISVSKKIMDYIIIDAPPMSVSADTEILADCADASLLVVKQSTSKAKNINDSIDILTNSKSELLGCVYNNVHTSWFNHNAVNGYRYNSKGYYGYHNTEIPAHTN